MIYREYARRVQFLFGILSVLLVAFISYESLIEVSDEPTIEHLDKLVHFGAYFLLGSLMLPALRRIPPLIVFLGLVVFGAAIEIAQGTMGIGRSADILDACANTAGALAAVLVWAYLSKLIAKPKQSITS
jgi:VanZ family protein